MFKFGAPEDSFAYAAAPPPSAATLTVEDDEDIARRVRVRSAEIIEQSEKIRLVCTLMSTSTIINDSLSFGELLRRSLSKATPLSAKSLKCDVGKLKMEIFGRLFDARRCFVN